MITKVLWVENAVLARYLELNHLQFKLILQLITSIDSLRSFIALYKKVPLFNHGNKSVIFEWIRDFVFLLVSKSFVDWKIPLNITFNRCF